MDEKEKSFGQWSKRFGIVLGFGFLIFFFTFLFYMLFHPFADKTRGNGQVAAVALALFLLILLVTAGILLHHFKKLDQKKIFLLIVLASWVLSLAYICYNPSTVRQHDVWGNNEHSEYAFYIYDTGALPPTNNCQFYHPPLNAFLQSTWMHIMDFIVNLFGLTNYVSTSFQSGMYSDYNAYRYFLYGSCAILSCFYRFIESIFFIKILTLYKTEGKDVTLLACLACFYPRLNEFSGLLNNDPVSFLFSTLAIYYALRFVKEGKSWYSILMCAITLGLAMMGKLNSAVICLPIGFLFVYEFVRSCMKKKDSQKLWVICLQYVSFLVICGTLGLWFQVYVSKRFNQPFGYIYGQGTNLLDNLYVGDKSFAERFLFPSWSELTGTIFEDPYNNYNLWSSLVKSSLFDEVWYNSQNIGAGMVAEILLYLILLVHFVLFVRYVYLTIRYDYVKKIHKTTCYDKVEDNIFLLLFFLAEFGADLYFNIKMPYGCTMDFRYVMPLIIAYPLSYLFFFDRSFDEHIPFFKVLMQTEKYMIVCFLVTASLYYLS